MRSRLCDEDLCVQQRNCLKGCSIFSNLDGPLVVALTFAPSTLVGSTGRADVGAAFHSSRPFQVLLSEHSTLTLRFNYAWGGAATPRETHVTAAKIRFCLMCKQSPASPASLLRCHLRKGAAYRRGQMNTLQQTHAQHAGTTHIHVHAGATTHKRALSDRPRDHAVKKVGEPTHRQPTTNERPTNDQRTTDKQRTAPPTQRPR